MAVYNVLMAVVELVDARDEAEACEILAERLAAAGFETLETQHDGPLPHAFESEELPDATPVLGRETIAPTRVVNWS